MKLRTYKMDVLDRIIIREPTGYRWGYAMIEPKNANPPIHPKGTCQLCGKKLEGFQRKWCCKEHGHTYYLEYRSHKIVWSEFRDLIVERDEHTCQECKKVGNDVHHKVPIIHGGDEFDQKNCTTLCYECHKEKHIKGWKSGKARSLTHKGEQMKIGG